MKKQINTVIVDDDTYARSKLRRQLSQDHPAINVVGEATNASDAYQIIRSTAPDLVFLDVKGARKNLSIMDRFKERSFYTIFYSPVPDYALEAFKRNAFDYLLKPLNPSELKRSTDKLASEIHARTRYDDEEQDLRLEVFVRGRVHYVKQRDITFIEAHGSYSEIHVQSGEVMVVSKNLKSLSTSLSEKVFFRIHNSFLVNLRYVKNCNFSKKYCTMQCGRIIRMAVRRSDALRKRLDLLWSPKHSS